jgi:hypothetical protein
VRIRRQGRGDVGIVVGEPRRRDGHERGDYEAFARLLSRGTL